MHSQQKIKNMKKVMIVAIIALSIGTAVNAQIVSKVSPFGQVGVSGGVDKVINFNAEVGAQGGKNRVSVVGQSFDSNPNADRKYLVGVKYLRLISLLPNLQGTVSLTGKTRMDNTALYVVEPGVGFNFDFGRGLSLVTGVTSPITQVSFTNRQTTFAGNAGIKFNL